MNDGISISLQYPEVIAAIIICHSSTLFKTRQLLTSRGSHRDVVANVLDCNIVVSKFKPHSRNCVHFRTNTQWKGMNGRVKLYHYYFSTRMCLTLNNP